MGGGVQVGEERVIKIVNLEPNYSVVTLTTSYSGEIWMDGDFMGNDTTTLELVPGTYQVECRCDSIVSDTKTLDIKTAGDSLTVNLKAVKPITGLLSVSSTPENAAVMVDGLEVGKTPLENLQVRTGQRVVAVLLANHGANPQTVNITEENPVTLHFELEELYRKVETPAQFPGGKAAMNAWVNKHRKIPANAQSVHGLVKLSAIVNRDGTITDVKVVSSRDTFLSQEAMRLIKIMPKWEPAQAEGHPVRSQVQIPITF